MDDTTATTPSNLETESIIKDITKKGDISVAKELFKNKHAEDLFPPQRKKLVTVKTTDKLTTAFKALNDNNILSAPVYDVHAHRYVGMIDILDILAYTMRCIGEVLSVNGQFEDILGDFGNITCGELTDLSHRNPYYPIEQDAPLLTVLSAISVHKMHRVPVVDREGNLITIITQSHVIHLVSQNLRAFGELPAMKIGTLRLGYRQVISVNRNQQAIHAFKTMFDHSVSAVAVVDDDGILVGNISASDLKVIGYDAHLLDQLFVPITEFLQKLPQNEVIPGPIAVTPETTVEETIEKIHLARVHRAYVVEDGKPIGVIATYEIIKAITAWLS